MGTNWAFVPCCLHRILVGPWPEELVRWCQQGAPLTLTLSPACFHNKIFLWCCLSLDPCAGFGSGAANKGWGSLAMSHQGRLPAVFIICLQLSMPGLGSRGWASSQPGCPRAIRRLWASPVPFTVTALQVGLSSLGDVSRVRYPAFVTAYGPCVKHSCLTASLR